MSRGFHFSLIDTDRVGRMSSEDLRNQLAGILVDESELSEVPPFVTALALLALLVALAAMSVSALSAYAQALRGNPSSMMWLMNLICTLASLSTAVGVGYSWRQAQSQAERRGHERTCADEIVAAWLQSDSAPPLFQERIRRIVDEHSIPMEGVKLTRIHSLFATCRIQRAHLSRVVSA
jgi:hypothetical protein